MSNEVRLGFFVVLTLGILVGGVFYIGNKEMRFSSTYRVNAVFQNVSGLNGGAEVRVGGIHEGTVGSINLPAQPGGKVTVVIDLKNGTRDIVRKDSVAAIKSEGLLGDKYVEISFGSKAAAKVKNGDTIGSEPPLDISDLLAKTNQILDTTKDAMESAEETASNLSSISGKINQGKGSIGALINDKTVYNEASKAATDLQENMEALKHNFLTRGFFKNRGYEDSSELTKNGISQLPAARETKSFAYDANRIFDKNSTAKLKDQKTLNEAGGFLQENRFGLAVVAVSGDLTGDSDKQGTLTEARAAVVRDYLVKNFRFDDKRVKTIGFGKANSQEDADRLAIVIYPVGTNTPSPQRSPTKRESENGRLKNESATTQH